MTPLPLDDTLVHVAQDRLDSLLAAQRLGSLPPNGKTEITRIMRTLAGRGPTTQLILMAGLPGSGKTQLARHLEAHGFLRISPDEQVWRAHGHYGRDFPRGQYKIRERPILEQLETEVHDALVSGRDVVMDHGFWTANERKEWQRVGEEAGATTTLIYLPATPAELWERIRERNQQTYDDPNAMYFSEADLRRHASRFESPGEDEPHITYTGNPDPVIRAVLGSGAP